MRRRKRRVFELESFEQRFLLSGLAPPTEMAGSAHVRPATTSTTKPVHLDGPLKGKYAVETSTPDTGTRTRLIGAGKLTGIGSVVFVGQWKSVGLIASGQPAGSLTLISARGSVTLELTAPTEAGPTSLPAPQFGYRIKSGTGFYRQATDTGTLTFALNPSTTPSGRISGKVTLALKSNHVTMT